MTFDEAAYLDANPDVRRGVQSGHWPTAYDHWVACGQSEGRRLSPMEFLPVQRFLNAVMQEPRVPIAATIVTAADSTFFLPLQCLLASLRVSHVARVVVIDLGLAEFQRDWCRRHGAEIIQLPADAPFPPGSINWWQTWNKPFHIRAVGGRVLYIDPDAIVSGPLDWLDRTLAERPIAFADVIAIHRAGWGEGTGCMANAHDYYVGREVDSRFRPGEHPSGGVIGLDLDRDRDREILATWCHAVNEAAHDEIQRHSLAWCDQGCLQWALEKCNATHLVHCDSRYNETVLCDNLKSLDAVIELIEGLRGTRIIHFAGDRKPYKFFPPDFFPSCENYPTNRRDLTLFVLGHERERLDAAPRLSHIKTVHLPDIELENDLAESRVFFSGVVDCCPTEYIGLCTARWDEKYAGECWPLAELHRLRFERDVVWAARPSQHNWVIDSDNHHAGMTAILYRVAESLGLKNLSRPAPWSNNFIAHRDVMADILRWWRRCWAVLFAEFGRPPQAMYLVPEGCTRPLSYLAERLTMLYFCSRDDLAVRKIPK